MPKYNLATHFAEELRSSGRGAASQRIEEREKTNIGSPKHGLCSNAATVLRRMVSRHTSMPVGLLWRTVHARLHPRAFARVAHPSSLVRVVGFVVVLVVVSSPAACFDGASFLVNAGFLFETVCVFPKIEDRRELVLQKRYDEAVAKYTEVRDSDSRETPRGCLRVAV